MTAKQQSLLKPGSLVDRLVSIEVGGNVTVSQPQGDAAGSFDAWVSATKRRILNTLSPAIARATDRHPERDFEIESGVMISGQNRLYVVAVVTRVADRA